jgi:hypothetical protein
MNLEMQHLIVVAQNFAPSLKRLELHKVALRRRLPAVLDELGYCDTKLTTITDSQMRRYHKTAPLAGT